MTLEIDTYKWDSMCIIGGGTDIYEQVGGGGRHSRRAGGRQTFIREGTHIKKGNRNP